MGLMKGLERAGQSGAALIWGLALTSKLVASLECPVIVGARGGERYLVLIKLQRATVASWGCEDKGGMRAGLGISMGVCGVESQSLTAVWLWACGLTSLGPCIPPQKQGEWYLLSRAAPGVGPGPGEGTKSVPESEHKLVARMAFVAPQRHLLTAEQRSSAPASLRPPGLGIFWAAKGTG